MKKFVGNMKEFVESMKKYEGNMKKCVKNMKEYAFSLSNTGTCLRVNFCILVLVRLFWCTLGIPLIPL